MRDHASVARAFLSDYFSDDRDFADIHLVVDGNWLKMSQGIGPGIRVASFDLSDVLLARDMSACLERLVDGVRKVAREWNPRPWWDTPRERPKKTAGKWRKFGRAA